ncbi:MAG: hypothetical protein Q9212_002402 [Teloschistes hypoglaucus]
MTNSRLSRLPPWASRWLGYRATPPKESAYVVALWSFIGAFCGLAVLQAISGQAEYFIDRKVPPILASYGASAVLCYGAIEAPLAQPRALMVGHTISALIAVSITKLFELLGPERFESLRWLVGSLSTAVAIVIMQITKTTHPPAGATALLAAVDDDVRRLSWYLLPVVLLSCTVVLVTALLFNNIQRRFPVFWFEPTVPAVAEPSTNLGGSVGEPKPIIQSRVSRSSSLTLPHPSPNGNIQV